MHKWKAHVAQLFPIFIGFTLCFLALQLVFLWNFNSNLFLSAGIVSTLKLVSNLSIGWIMVSLIHLISP
ncbi:MAG: hypothetical protein ACKOQ2_32265, partial [Dolichospermum sp.]